MNARVRLPLTAPIRVYFMDNLKEFITWLETYSEGHEVIATDAVLYQLKMILSTLQEERTELLIMSRIKDACPILSNSD